MKKQLQLLGLVLTAIILFSCKKKTPAVVYNNFKINSIQVTQIPFLDGSSTWDPIINTDPDPFINIEDANNNILYDGSSDYKGNAALSSLPLSWTLASPYQITNTATTFNIAVYDLDTPPVDANDLMARVSFKMDDHKSGYPSTFQIGTTGVNITVTGTWY